MTTQSARLLYYLLGFVVVLGVLVAGILAFPITLWRTGETPLPALRYLPVAAHTTQADRLWLDADPACGTGQRRDPDDCLALLSLVAAKHLNIVGISTVFGNAPVSETDAVMRALVAEIRLQGGPALPVFLGCGAPTGRCLESGGSSAAQVALVEALHAGSLDYVALGPLTNLAAVLRREPGLARNISRVIAVMGRRPGHRFHPSENRATGAMLLGHGPIFRDLNAVLDPQAVAVVLQSGIPLVLIPYTAARAVLITSRDLDAMARAVPAGPWVASRSRAWLQFWHRDVGLDGFYPFDLMAAAYLRTPQLFRCSRVTPWVGDDARLPWFGGGPTLLVSQPDTLSLTTSELGSAIYCDALNAPLGNFFSSEADAAPPQAVQARPSFDWATTTRFRPALLAS